VEVNVIMIANVVVLKRVTIPSVKEENVVILKHLHVKLMTIVVVRWSVLLVYAKKHIKIYSNVLVSIIPIFTVGIIFAIVLLLKVSVYGMISQMLLHWNHVGKRNTIALNFVKRNKNVLTHKKKKKNYQKKVFQILKIVEVEIVVQKGVEIITAFFHVL
jgi:hypothetical protein